MAHFTRRNVLHAAGVAGMIVSSRRSAQAGVAAARLLRIGFQKGEPILLAAKQNRSLERLLNPLDIEVQWIEFQFGPPMLEAMRVNSVDIGAVGDTPPVFAQAAHGDLLYIAAQRSGGQAILVPPGSTLQTLHDLKGRKVAFGCASSAHNLTLAALERRPPPTTTSSRSISAPPTPARHSSVVRSMPGPSGIHYYALFETRPGVRTFAKWTDITEQNSFFMCRRAYVEANAAGHHKAHRRVRPHRGMGARRIVPELAGLAREWDRHAARRRTARRGPSAVPGAPHERRARPRTTEDRRPFSRPRTHPDGDLRSASRSGAPAHEPPASLADADRRAAALAGRIQFARDRGECPAGAHRRGTGRLAARPARASSGPTSRSAPVARSPASPSAAASASPSAWPTACRRSARR